jgi:hypothetical protein
MVSDERMEHCMMTGRVFAFFWLLGIPLAAAGEGKCTGWYAKLNESPKIRVAAKAAGTVIGSANGIVITVLGGTGFVPKEVAAWLPFTNEIANISKTATGKDWIYSGISKQMADGVALGAIFGHTLSATTNHGPLTGGLTLAANLGLTYWFPNKYLHSIMHGAAGLVPESLPKLKRFANRRVGQGMVGISVVVIVEQLLKRAEELAETAPHLWDSQKGDTDSMDDQIRKAGAAFLLDAQLEPDADQARHRKLLQYLFGISREQGLFSAFPEQEPELQLNEKEKSKIKSLLEADLLSLTKNQLHESEAEDIKHRAALLLGSDAP